MVKPLLWLFGLTHSQEEAAKAAFQVQSVKAKSVPDFHVHNFYACTCDLHLGQPCLINLSNDLMHIFHNHKPHHITNTLSTLFLETEHTVYYAVMFI